MPGCRSRWWNVAVPDTSSEDAQNPSGMPWHELVPILTDGVVRLRPHDTGDVERIVEQCTDLESVLWTTAPRDYTAAMATSWLDEIGKAWREGGDKVWAIEEADDDEHRFLGSIDLRPRRAGRAEIGYGLHPEGRGRGLMARAVRLICQHWFDGGGKRVDWYANRGNFSSWAVARASGFSHVATLPGHVPDGDGVLVDAWFATLENGEPMAPVAPWHEVPVLDGERVRLRPWSDDDTAVAEPHDHPAHHLPARAVPTEDTFVPWLLRRREQMAWGRSVNWCIADPDSDDPLGEVLVFVHEGTLDEGGSAELGAFLRPSARGDHRAVEAGRLAVAHAFRAVADGGLGLRRLVAESAADNDPSNAVLTTLGFTRWGVEPDATAPDGSVSDAHHWTLLPGEFDDPDS